MVRDIEFLEAHPNLLQALFEEDLLPRDEFFCAGIGHCGKCRVRYSSPSPDPTQRERDLLTEIELAVGNRLACQHCVEPGIRVVLDKCLVEGSYRATAKPQTTTVDGLVLDIGTTVVKWMAGTRSGETFQGSATNPQMPAGGDVLARLSYALGSISSARRLQKVLLETIWDACRCWYPSDGCQCALAGNPIMVHILLDLPLCGLGWAPYHMPYMGNDSHFVLDGWPKFYVPPLISPFVGADLSSCMFHIISEMDYAPEYPILTVDFGTNGELALAVSESEVLVSSVPMGPCIEGSGMRSGAMAGSEVATRFKFDPRVGIKAFDPHGREVGSLMRGVAGTGYISLLALLVRLGLVGTDGIIRTGSGAMKRLIPTQDTGNGRKGFRIGGVVFDGMDIESILLVKSACNTAVSILLDQAGITVRDLKRVYVTGAMGLHFQASDLVEIGFFPEELQGRIVPVCNATIQGLWAYSKNPIRSKDWFASFANRTRAVDLTAVKGFSERFTAGMSMGFI